MLKLKTMYHVYKIVNTKGIIEYIGETKNTYARLANHKAKGKRFYGRDDIDLVIIKSFITKREALDYENILQIEYGFPADRETHGNNALKSAWDRNEILVYKYKTGEFVGEFKSQYEAAAILKIHQPGIHNCLKGKQMQTMGYKIKLKNYDTN